MQGYFFWRILILKYIIFDLEWDNFYNYKTKNSINEIIEIGAVKLNDRLEIVDTYKQLIKPRFLKKLSKRCADLTKISYDEMVECGVAFEKAIDDFKKWSAADDETVFFSWSMSDMYALAYYYSVIFGNCRIDFIKHFCDAQQYCTVYVPTDKRHGNNQLSLAYCAEVFGIQTDTEKLHRALMDCYVTADCLKSVFDKDTFSEYVNDCDNVFFERLLYKPYLIVNPHTDIFDINSVVLRCPECNSVLNGAGDVAVKNKAFSFATKCSKCNKPYWAFVRAKKTYDKVEVKQKLIVMNKRKAKHYQ